MPIVEMTILEMQEKMTCGEINSAELVAGYLERIEALDRSGPHLNSLIELNPDALADAARLDGERAKGQVRGLLHGVPIVLKDNIDTADRMSTPRMPSWSQGCGRLEWC
jgi:amidase